MEAMVHLVPSCVPIKNYQRLDFMFGSDLPIPSSHIKYARKRPPWFSIGAKYSFWGPIFGGWDYIARFCPPSGPLTEFEVQHLIYRAMKLRASPILAMINFWADQSAMFCENVNLLRSQLIVACIKCTLCTYLGIGQK
jgi:hypothetical protein